MDEVRHPLAGSVRKQRQPFNHLHVLSNEWRMPAMALRTHEALDALQADPSDAPPFKPFALPRWHKSAALREFVVGVG